MADFVQKTANKTAVRDLAVPIATVTSFNTIIESVINDNPFGCVGYTGSDGVPVEPVVRNREHYTLMSELPRRRGQAGGQRLAPVPDDRRVRGEHRRGHGQRGPCDRDAPVGTTFHGNATGRKAGA